MQEESLIHLDVPEGLAETARKELKAVLEGEFGVFVAPGKAGSRAHGTGS